MSQHTDITIIRIDAEKTQKDLGTPSLYRVHLLLSGQPSEGWISLFNQCWREEKTGRAVEFDDWYLIVICEPAEIGQRLNEPLKIAVAKVNMMLRAHEKREESKRELERQRSEENARELQQAKDELSKIKF